MERPNPLISVIIPNYNHAPYLEERIQSVLQQSLQNFEVIILDDNSTDNSRDIIRRYQDNEKVAHIIYNTQNSGSTFRQWRKGFQLARGKYIWIAESDDTAEYVFLETLIQCLYENPQAVLAYSNSLLIDKEGKECKGRNNTKPYWTKSFTLPGNTFIRKHLLMNNSIANASAVLFRKDVLKNIPEYMYTCYKACGDKMFWISLALQGDICYVSNKLNKFRQHVQKVTPNAIYTGITTYEDYDIYIKTIPNISLTLWDRIIINGFYYCRITDVNIDRREKPKLYKLWQNNKEFNKLSYYVYKFARKLNLIN